MPAVSAVSAVSALDKGTKTASAERLEKLASVIQGHALYTTLELYEQDVATFLSLNLLVAKAVCCGVNKQSLGDMFRVILCSKTTGATVEIDMKANIEGIASIDEPVQKTMRINLTELFTRQSIGKEWNVNISLDDDPEVCMVAFARDTWDYLEKCDSSLRGNLPGRAFARLARYRLCAMYDFGFIVARSRLELWVLGEDECVNLSCTTGTGRVKLCTGCQMARYCSKECQAADWDRHKSMCRQRGSVGCARIVKLQQSAFDKLQESAIHDEDDIKAIEPSMLDL